MITLGNERSGAVFSDCKKYRYRLWREWDAKLPRCCFVLLNPSTADEIDNDPTIERQQRRVLAWSGERLTYFDRMTLKQFGSIEIVNAFAFRSTPPRGLYSGSPVGDDNDAAILNATTYAHGSGGLVVCGWGRHALTVPRSTALSRHAFLCGFFARHNIPVAAFNLNGDGTPTHPLYLSYDLKPRRWKPGSIVLSESVI